MNIESDFREQRLEAIRKQNRLNRQRSRAMEQRIAKILNGRRVPLSGSGGLKGDVVVNTKFGRLFIECKLSESYHAGYNCPDIVLSYSYFKKMERQATYMKARLQALVFHYHNVNADYVVMNKTFFDIIHPTPRDMPFVNERETKTMHFFLRKVKEWVREYGYAYFRWYNDVYVVMHLQTFKSLLDETEDTDLLDMV